ncbi:MAG: ABC transporter permease [Verrucomicrobiota bacterium]|jgi:ABC-type Na+ efflux pump permease subunit
MFGGGIWPVVQRELRDGARRPFNHWLRVGGGIGAVIVFWAESWDVPASVAGIRLFMSLHRLVLAMIFCVVPALTADCIARERREGTLGLLFLTPLRAWEIVVGKVLAQVLKALTLWLAVLPVLTIPFLAGGVGWMNIAGCLTSELCAGMICLAAGIVASSVTEKRATAFVLAFAIAAALVVALHQERWWNAYYTVQIGRTFIPVGPGTIVRPRFGPPINYGSFGPWGPAFLFPPGAGGMWLSRLLEGVLMALLVLWGAIRFAGYCVERAWRDKGPSVRQQSWVKRFCTPIFQRAFARSMRRTMERNPVAWLQQYSWKARLTKWGLCLAFVLLECAVTDGANPFMIEQWEWRLLVVLAAAYTYAGVNGFLQEKRSGALELMLVTPLSVNQIIFGRVWGLWKQFLPAALLLAGCYYTTQTYLGMGSHWNNFKSWFGYRPPNMGYVSVRLWWMRTLIFDTPARDWAIIIGFLTLPIFATFFALRVKNLVLATVYTWLTLLLAPIAGVTAFWVLVIPAYGEPAQLIQAVIAGIVLGNAAFVWLTVRALRRSLARRIYSF